MRKGLLVLGVLLVLTAVFSTNARAEDVTAWQGFWNSVGGFFYNALPWNWGNWAAK